MMTLRQSKLRLECTLLYLQTKWGNRYEDEDEDVTKRTGVYGGISIVDRIKGANTKDEHCQFFHHFGSLDEASAIFDLTKTTQIPHHYAVRVNQNTRKYEIGAWFVDEADAALFKLSL